MKSEPGLKKVWALPALVVAASFLVYAGTVRFGFVYDDQGQIVRNLFIQSWQYVPRYFTSHVWSYLFPGHIANYYRPFFLLWLRMNDAMFGLHPSGWHLTSVLAHCVVTLELYWLGVRWLGDRAAAAVAAALFGLHPIHVEAVAWVSGVTEPLVAALLLGSLLTFIRAQEPGGQRAGWWAASQTLYALALLSKETALIFPALVFLQAWFERSEPEAGEPRGRAIRFRDSLLHAGPYLALTAAYLPLRIYALGGFSHALTPVPLATSLLTWPSLLWFYASKLLWPAGLSPFYDLAYVSHMGFHQVIQPLLGIAIMATLLGFWVWRSAKAPSPSRNLKATRTLGISLAWMCLPMVPLADLSVFGAGDIAHDRYLYIPSIGAAWMAGLAWKSLAARRGAGRRGWVMAGAFGVAAVLAAGTVMIASYWSDNLSLYTRGVKVAPNNVRARLDLANAACDRGLYDAGLKLYDEVIARAPNFPLAFYDLGVTELELGRLPEADRDLTRAIELDANDPSAYYSLGLARFREGKLEESAGLLRRALELQPEAVGYHLALGRVLESQGDLRGARELFLAEFAAHPQLTEARDELLRLDKSAPPQGTSSGPPPAIR